MNYNDAFSAGLGRGIAYAQKQIKAAGSNLKKIDPLKESFYQLITMGLRLEAMWRSAAELALVLFRYVEARRFGNELKPLLQSAVSRCEVGDEHLNGQLLNRLGQLCRIDRRYDEAVQLLNEGLKVAQSANELHLMGQIHWNLAATIHELNTRGLENAKQHALTALEYLTITKSQKRGQTLNRLGLIIRDLGNDESAIKYFHESITILKEAEDWIDAIRVMNNLGESYRRKSEYSKAIKIYEESILLSKKFGDSILLTQMLLNLGTVYATQELYELAERTFSKIDTTELIQRGDLSLLAYVYNNLGYAQTHLGQFDVAEALLEESLAIRQSLGNGILIAATLDSLATLFYQTSRIEESIQLYREGLKYLEQHPKNTYAKNLWEQYNARMEQIIKE